KGQAGGRSGVNRPGRGPISEALHESVAAGDQAAPEAIEPGVRLTERMDSTSRPARTDPEPGRSPYPALSALNEPTDGRLGVRIIDHPRGSRPPYRPCVEPVHP